MSPIDPLAEDRASGIPPTLLQDLHSVLVTSPHFDTHASLRALFNDARIAPWRNQLPQVEQLEKRVGQVIDLLHPAQAAAGENALQLLLLVLADNTPREQHLHYHLKALARKLAQPWELQHTKTEPVIKEPYLGLRAFQEEDTALFFGREALVTELLEKVEESTFLAVLGPSGSGKSSAVLAGLLPALRQGEQPGSSEWHHLVFKPGPRPLNALAAALTHLPDMTLPDVMILGQRLADDDKALLFVADQLQARLLLVVDQFEEVWTQASRELGQQQAFIRLILTAAAAPRSPLLVILTLRADFLHLAANHPALTGWIKEHLVLVSPMGADELREVIEQPAALAGGGFEPRLAERLIAEVEGKAGALPLLGYTLHELWNRRNPDDNTMTWDAFEVLGGVEGALAARADEIVDENYTYEEREELRHLLLRLVQPGEGVEDTSRRMALSDIVPEGSSIAAVQLLLQPLVDERLLTSNRDPMSGEESIEVSHEALIRSWGTLRGWIEKARDDLRQRSQLEESTREWEANKKDPAFLWSGLRLDIAEVWLARVRPRLNERDQRFLQACRNQKEVQEAAARARLEREDADRQERERLLTERASAEAQARSEAEARSQAARRNLRVVTMLLAIALLLAALAWNSQRLESEARQVAEQEKNRAEESTQLETEARQAAERQADIASRQGAAGKALFELSQGNPEGALLLALVATRNILDANSALTSRALWTILDEARIEHRLAGHTGAITVVAFNPDGQQVLTGSDDGTVRLWDASNGQLRRLLEGHTAPLSAVAFSPDGQQVLTGSNDGTAHLWDAASGQLLHTLEGHSGPVAAVAFSPKGQQVLTGSDDGTARLWDAASGNLLHPLQGHTFPVTAVAFSPDGQQVLTGSDGARLWDASSGQLLHSLEGHGGAVYAVDFSPDGQQVFTGSDDGARLWDTSNGQLLHPFQGHMGWVDSVAFSPDGQQVLTGGADGAVRLWGAHTGQFTHTLEGHGGAVYVVAFSPDGQQVLTGSEDGARLWDASSGQLLHTLRGHSAAVVEVAFSPNGRQVLTGSQDGTARLWNVSSSVRLHLLQDHTDLVTDAAFSLDGQQVLTGSNDGTARLWDASGGDLLHTLEGHTDWVHEAAFSPDGQQVLTGSDDGTARLWDASSGQLLHLLQHTGAVYAVAFSPDGQQVLTGSLDGTARLWDASGGDLLRSLRGHTEVVIDVAFSADGQQVLTGSYDVRARLWDASSGDLLHTLEGHNNLVNDVAFSPDGRQVLTGSDDGTARLWDASSGQLLHSLEGYAVEVYAVAFSPDGQQVLTGSWDGARLWDASSGQLLHSLEGHGGAGYAVAFSPDGRQVLTGSEDGTARLWDAASGDLLQPLQGHTFPVAEVAFSPNGRQVLTSSQDGAHLWIVSEALLVARLTEIVCHIRTNEEIKAEIEEWQGCDAELAAVASDLATYHTLWDE